jgi:hypothetical protein
MSIIHQLVIMALFVELAIGFIDSYHASSKIGIELSPTALADFI